MYFDMHTEPEVCPIDSTTPEDYVHMIETRVSPDKSCIFKCIILLSLEFDTIWWTLS